MMNKEINVKRTRVRVLNVNLGCEPSAALINKIVLFLRINGYEVVVDRDAACDIIIINACCFIEATTVYTKEYIERSLGEKAIQKVICFGCFTAADKRQDTDLRLVRITSKELEKFNEQFDHKVPIEDIPGGPLEGELFKHSHTGINHNDSFILISQGCTEGCTYCNIKKAKGYVVSRSIADVVADIKQGVLKQQRDFALISDDCGSYGEDINADLSSLVKEILNQCPQVRLKINYVYPGHLIRLFPSLRESIASGGIVYMNVPLQSGSPRVLKLMNRDYDIEQVKRILKEIKEISPGLWLHTHFIVNFPTETLEDFLSTLRTVSLFDDFMFFGYSDFTSAPSSKIFPKVEKKERERRIEICQKIIDKLNHGIYCDNIEGRNAVKEFLRDGSAALVFEKNMGQT